MWQSTVPKRPLYFSLSLLALLALIPLAWLEKNASISPSSTLQFSHQGGYYDDSFFLELSGSGSIWFTLDGRSPSPNNATRYTGPIPMSTEQPQVVIIRARLQTADNQLGPVISHSYFLNIPAELPLLSLIVEPDDFWGEQQGIITNYEEHGLEWERPVDITFVDSDRQSGFHVPAGVRVHGRGSRPLEKKSLRLYFRNEYGLSRLVYPLFAEGSGQSFKRLVVHNGGQDSTQPGVNWTILRNQIAASLAQSIGANATRSRPALVFINGELWGIYQIRERIDDFFLADHFGITTADMLDTPEELIRTDHVVLGSRDHWDAMMAFVETHDLTDPVNYAYLATQMDIANYIDYNLLQIYIANDDWPHHNMRVFRSQQSGGRWQWMFWDTDRSFAFRLASPVSKDMIVHAQTNVPTASGRQVVLLQKLLANPDFRNAFLVRLALLLNSEFAPKAVLAQIEALAGAIAPDINYEVGRWETDGNTWQTNIEELRDFARRRPDFVRQHVVTAFELPGTAVLQLNIPPNGAVVLEERLMNASWTGTFFQGTIVRVTAVPRRGYQFTGWQEVDGLARLELAILGDQALTPQFAPLPDDVPRWGDMGITAVMSDHIELQTTRPLDLRGWRLTDNDTPAATNEGSLIFTNDPALAQVAADTKLWIASSLNFSGDELEIDGKMVLSAANGRLDINRDPWFHLEGQDVLVLLAPGETAAFTDDQAIAAYSANPTPLPVNLTTAFGILPDNLINP